MLKFIFGGGEF